MNRDRNCLSYWFPKLESAGIPVPRTEVVRWLGAKWSLVDGMDGKEGPPEWDQFFRELRAVASLVGPCPVFLRTGQGSGKHQWKNTCFVRDLADLEKHVCAIVEWSHMVDMLGLPHDVWAVREMLPVRPVAHLRKYGSFPLVRELRCFIQAGEVVCHHDYWPERDIRRGLDSDTPEAMVQAIVSGSRLSPAEKEPALALAAQVAEIFAGDGAWSVDVLETAGGWYVTDMAIAGESYHWESCPNNGRNWEALR